MSAVHKQELSCLQPGAQNALVIGIIIHSLNTRTIDATRTRYNSGERGVWTFTLRDSEKDSVNVTVWGSVEFINKLFATFGIGDVVEVINPKVVGRRPDDRNEFFVPSVTCPFSLTINEGNALVQIHDAPTRERYERLLMFPIKLSNKVQSLKDVLENLEALRDQYVDILVVVTFTSVTRNVITRDGRYIKCLNFEATDGTTDEIVPLILWENKWIERAVFWEPRNTVLLLNDARVGYDNYRKKIALSIVRKTLIIENPDIPKAATVRDAVRYFDPDNVSSNPFVIPNLLTINNVMTIEDISKKLNKTPKPGERIQFTAILKAVVIEFNTDSKAPGIIIIRCALCKKVVADIRDSCMELECPSGNGSRVPLNVMSLNLKVNLKDDTGYLIGCRLTGDVAERALGCTVTEFQAMELLQRADLKLKYMLEKCEIRLQVLGPTSGFSNARYNILSISTIYDEDEEQTMSEMMDVELEE